MERVTFDIDQNKTYQLTKEDFEDVFQESLSKYVQERIREYNFVYSKVTFDEFSECLRQIIETLLNPNITKSGEHRREAWEKGWGENLQKFNEHNSIEAINPLYFKKYSVVRWKQNFIKPLSDNFECNSLAIIQDWLFDKYVRKASAIYEFGCGTGHNLLRVRNVNPLVAIWGLDWVISSQNIINEMVNKGIVNNFHAHNFDYFKPDTNFNLENDSIVYTVASLEQIGSRFKPFVNYLLLNKPKLCIHIEPIVELLNKDNLLDYLSIEYCNKRNYLNGFLAYLRQLENKNTIKIHRLQRTYIGSLYIDGYSVIVWSPN